MNIVRSKMNPDFVSKKLLTVILVLLASSVIQADYWYGDFTDDRTVVFSDEAVLYTVPNADSSIFIQLPMGSPVTIPEGGNGEYNSNGLTSYWYKTVCQSDDSEYTGFIPGCELAMSDMVLAGDTLFLFTVTGYNEELYQFIGEARVVSSGEILADIEVDPMGSSFDQGFYRYNTECLQYDQAGLTGVKNLIELSFLYPACGYTNCDILFAWTGSELIAGPVGYSMAEAGCFHVNSHYILPSDSTGTVNEVVVETILEEFDDDTMDYFETERTAITFKWDGTEFIELPVE